LFLLPFKFGIAEMMTKINVLEEDLTVGARYCPIEHVESRLRPRDSLLAKACRIGCDLTPDGIRDNIADIAGVRIVCSFISDVYTVMEMLTRQADVTLVQVKDYVARPKPNGYKSLHLIVDTPVHLSGSAETVRLEVQIRTVAMDFWASLEHKIYYKYAKDVPATLRAELLSAAEAANHLDEKMELLHREVLNGDLRRYGPPRVSAFAARASWAFSRRS
jgi:putative GTP pyrophosphokinase